MQLGTESLETLIVNQLKSADGLRDLQVQAFPEQRQDFLNLAPKGAVLVHYLGSAWPPSKTGETALQPRKMTWGVMVGMKNLRTHAGAYATLDAVRAALTGFVLPGCSQMTPSRETFDTNDNGTWWYAVEFTASQVN